MSLFESLKAGVCRSAGDLLDAAEIGGKVRGASDRQRVVAIMVATIDGRTTNGSSSAALGSDADTALLRALRTRADVLLVGSRTIAAEGYGELIDDHGRAERTAVGLTPHPPVATISRRLDLDPGSDLLATPDLPVIVFTESQQSPPTVAATLDLVRMTTIDPQRMIVALAARGLKLIVCEGGPTLLGRLAGAGLIDDLLLTVSPQLIGASGPTLLGDVEFQRPLAMRVTAVWRADEHLFIHYQAVADGQ